MTRVDHSLVVPPPHRCDLPDPMQFRHDEVMGLIFTLDHPPGTRLYCDCGLTWVVVWREPVEGPRIYVAGRHEWRVENRRERRARLGRRWWQR